MGSFKKLTKIFQEKGHYDNCIDILQSDDYYTIIVTFYRAFMDSFDPLPEVKKERKSETKSDWYREEGDRCLYSNQFDRALQFFNTAVIFAPPKSDSLLGAIVNRTTTYSKMKNFTAALRDLELSLSLDTHGRLKTHEEKIRSECEVLMWQESMLHNNALGNFNDTKECQEFFTVQGKRNPQLPFATQRINVVMDSGKQKVVATSDIKIGTVLAVESATVTCNKQLDMDMLCDFCSKFATNMISCDHCALVLYCDEECKSKAWDEGHDIECSMEEIVLALPLWIHIWFKYILKQWRMCQNLESFAKIFETMNEYIKDEQRPPRFDITNSLTHIQAPKENAILHHGKLYDAAIYTALIIHGLTSVSVETFKCEEKPKLIEEIAKQLLYHVLHSTCTGLPGTLMGLEDNTVTKGSTQYQYIGVYPFVSRIRHACNSNTERVALGNRAALVCVAPIKSGMEITVSYGGHYLSTAVRDRQAEVFNSLSHCCDCIACRQSWSHYLRTNAEDLIHHCSGKNVLLQEFEWSEDHRRKYEILCEVMDAWYSEPATPQCAMAYFVLQDYLCLYQFGVIKQRIEGRPSPDCVPDDVYDIVKRF